VRDAPLRHVRRETGARR